MSAVQREQAGHGAECQAPAMTPQLARRSESTGHASKEFRGRIAERPDVAERWEKVEGATRF